MKLLLLFLILCVKLIIAEVNNSTDTIRLPAEWDRQEKVFMIWPKSVHQWYWRSELLPLVREVIANIANAIVAFEPVVMFCDPSHIPSAKSYLDGRIKIVKMFIDDLWARDTMPVLVLKTSSGSEKLVAVDFNFHGWGGKQIHANDALVARRFAKMYNMERRTSSIVAEGGSFVTDGRGTLLATESSIINTNRNTKSKEEIEKDLKSVLGVKKVIWFKGVRGSDMTDYHVDAMVRFVRPGVIVLNRPFRGNSPDVWSKSSEDAASVLRNATDADGNPFQVIDVVEANPNKIAYKGDTTTYLCSYVNFLIANGCVIIPAFGDEEADSKAQRTFEKLFPDRKVVPVLQGILGVRGGGIHCTTCEIPLVNYPRKN